MAAKSTLAAWATASLFGFAAHSSVIAEEMDSSVPEMEQEQLDDSVQSDVDPDASMVADEPIQEEERDQIQN